MKELKSIKIIAVDHGYGNIKTANTVTLHFTELSGHHSVLERPLSEVNGRLFFS